MPRSACASGCSLVQRNAVNNLKSHVFSSTFCPSCVRCAARQKVPAHSLIAAISSPGYTAPTENLLFFCGRGQKQLRSWLVAKSPQWLPKRGAVFTPKMNHFDCTHLCSILFRSQACRIPLSHSRVRPLWPSPTVTATIALGEQQHKGSKNACAGVGKAPSWHTVAESLDFGHRKLGDHPE